MNQPWVRAISLLLSLAVSAILLLYPPLVMDSQNQADHSLLMIVLAGIMLGFIHGVGFKPLTTFWQLVISPIISWPILLTALVFAAE